MKNAANPSAESGLTLLELLVVMSLMSLIMLAMAGALRGMGQTETRIDQRLARMDEFRVVTGFLNASIGNVSARTSDQLPASGKPAVIFSGQAQSLAWVGVLPARDGAGGRYFFKLSLEDAQAQDGIQGSESGLVLRLLPFTPSTRFPDWAQAETRVLVPRVRTFSIAYEDRLETPAGWKPEWEAEGRLPDAVRIVLGTATSEWPVLVIPLRILPLGSNTGGGTASFGGGVAR